MHTKVLRELANVLTESLTIIFEKSWRTEERSENLKKANTNFRNRVGSECLVNTFTVIIIVGKNLEYFEKSIQTSRIQQNDE